MCNYSGVTHYGKLQTKCVITLLVITVCKITTNAGTHLLQGCFLCMYVCFYHVYVVIF